MKKKYDKTSVLRSITRRNGVNVNYSSKTVEILKDSANIGNGTWGKLDYLSHYCGWFISIVNSFNKKNNKVFIDDDSNSIINKKVIKHEKKLNLVKEVKSIMKKYKN